MNLEGESSDDPKKVFGKEGMRDTYFQNEFLA